MIHRVAKDDKLTKLPDWHATITMFITDEIIGFPLPSQQLLEKHLSSVGTTGLFDHWQRMTHERTTQHNLRVASKYYKRIRTIRLAELLGLSVDETETQLSTMVSEGSLYAKIDRPAGIVTFKRRVSPEETLSDWSSDIGQLLTLVERTCHLVNKEHMIHKL